MRPSSSSRVAGSFMNGANRPNTSSGFNGVPMNHGRVSNKYMPYALLDFEKQQVFVNSVDGTPENPAWAGSNTQYKFDVSRVTELVIHLYMRNPNAPPGSGRSQDIFLGVVRVNPRFQEKKPYVEDPKLSKKDREKAAAEYEARQRALGQSGVEWVDVQYGTGKLLVGVEYVENKAGKLKIEDFQLLKLVGKGSFGKVMQVKKKDTGRIYALKTIRKAHIISRSEVAHTLAERSVLSQINNPFIVPLKFTFQNPEKLYFVLAFVNGGELFFHLQKEQRFDVNRARFYTAELLCALECLHGFNVIYRDLKPENILLDYQGHIALCDFGLCKLDMKDEDRTNTFCGTPEYLAPELLMGQGYNKTVDWWTLGVLLYEMLTGLPPFYDENTNEMYRKILSEPLHFPGPEVVPPAAKDLLTKLLNRDPAQRLGANGSNEIKSHPFFHAIDWRKLLQRKYEPTFKPSVVRKIPPFFPIPLYLQLFLVMSWLWRQRLTVVGRKRTDRRARHDQLRQGLPRRAGAGLVCGGRAAVGDGAAALCWLQLQPSYRRRAGRGGTELARSVVSGEYLGKLSLRGTGDLHWAGRGGTWKGKTVLADEHMEAGCLDPTTRLTTCFF
jgi:serum/glucocorticoid-regulated kinase 2